MLAKLTDVPLADPGWLYERKFNGERVLAFRSGTEVRLRSRSEHRLDGTYPEVVDALRAQDADDFVVDGEVVAFDGRATSFAKLQGRLGISDPLRARASGIPVYYYVFDVLHLDGHDTRGLTQRDRKAVLCRALSFADPLRFSVHRTGAGEAFLSEACRRGWEGLIAKRADAPYVSRRAPYWLRLKCATAQELVVGGFTDPAGARSGLGALLVGHYVDGRLCFAGKVGTGFSSELLLELRDRLGELETPVVPFADPRRIDDRGVHWVRPELVAEIAFTEWTADGKLRHPRFVGLRTDKPAGEVVRELPVRPGGSTRERHGAH
jgi:DNA ligase D-like protein (predicted ligase)